MVCRVHRVCRQGRSMKADGRCQIAGCKKEDKQLEAGQSIVCSSSAVPSQLPEEPRAKEQSRTFPCVSSFNFLSRTIPKRLLHFTRVRSTRQKHLRPQVRVSTENSQRLFDNLKLQEQPCVLLPCIEHSLLQ